MLDKEPHLSKLTKFCLIAYYKVKITTENFTKVMNYPRKENPKEIEKNRLIC